MDALSAQSSSGLWCQEDIDEWEKLDRLLSEGCRATERKCPSIRSGQLPWLVELEQAGCTYLYWTLRVREFTAKETNKVSLDKLAELCQIPDGKREWLPSSLTRKLRHTARKAFTKVKQAANQLRDNHNHSVAKLAAQVHNMDVQLAQEAIAARERASQQFWQLRSILKPAQSHGFDRLDVPNEFAV